MVARGAFASAGGAEQPDGDEHVPSAHDTLVFVAAPCIRRSITRFDRVDYAAEPELRAVGAAGELEEVRGGKCGLVAKIERDHVVVIARGEEALLFGKREGLLQSGEEGVAGAKAFDQPRNVVGGVIGERPRVRFGVAFLLRGFERLCPRAVAIAGAAEADRRIEEVAVIAGPGGEEFGVVGAAEGGGELGEGPVVVGVFDRLCGAVGVDADRRQVFGNVAEGDIVFDAAAEARGVFVTGLAHEAAGEMVFTEGRIDGGEVVGVVEVVVKRAGEERGGLRARHDKRIGASGRTARNESAVAIHVHEAVAELVDELRVNERPERNEGPLRAPEGVGAEVAIAGESVGVERDLADARSRAGVVDIGPGDVAHGATPEEREIEIGVEAGATCWIATFHDDAGEEAVPVGAGFGVELVEGFAGGFGVEVGVRGDDGRIADGDFYGDGSDGATEVETSLHAVGVEGRERGVGVEDEDEVDGVGLGLALGGAVDDVALERAGVELGEARGERRTGSALGGEVDEERGGFGGREIGRERVAMDADAGGGGELCGDVVTVEVDAVVAGFAELGIAGEG